MDSLMPQLYSDLVSLCSSDPSFYNKEVVLDSIKYQIFNYRLGSYKSFHSYPSALNCRGIMFNVNDSESIQLVSLPPEKFFNYEEGPGYRQHELGQLEDQMDKMDGSLISTFLHIDKDGEQVLRLKSKTSVRSSQTVEAMQLLTGVYQCSTLESVNLYESTQKSFLGKFKREIEDLVRQQYTVNMEYTSPFNRIVLNYNQPQLTILSVRSHLNGETLFATRLKTFLIKHGYNTLLQYVVPFKTVPKQISQKAFVEDIRAETEGEGYVVEIIRPDGSSYLVKIKTHKYLLLHRNKSTINNPRSLFETVINEQSDDLRSLLQNDSSALAQISQMEDQVRPIFNRMIQLIEQFYDDNKHLSRKEYAILITNLSTMKSYMPLLMNLYSGKAPDYKQFAIIHAKDLFGINTQAPQINHENDEQE